MLRQIPVSTTVVQVKNEPKRLQINWSSAPPIEVMAPSIKNTGWIKTFAWWPVTTVSGERVRWTSVYKRTLTPKYPNGDTDWVPKTQYATDFDVLSGQYEDPKQYWPEWKDHFELLDDHCAKVMAEEITKELDRQVIESIMSEATSSTIKVEKSLVLPDEPWIIIPKK